MAIEWSVGIDQLSKVSPLFSHNLVELGEACARLQPDLEPLLRRAATLSDYAWQYRYPGDLD